MLLNLVRVVCILLTLGAVATAWIWEYRPKLITAFDWHSKKLYERGYEAEIKEIRGALATDENVEENLARLDEIRKKCEHTRFGDRLFVPWRAAVEVQTEKLVDLGKYEETVTILQGAVEKDPTHVPLHMRYAGALCMVGGPENFQRAKALIDGWARKLPTHPDVRAVQMLQQALARDVEGLADVLSKHLYSTMPFLTRGWQVYLFPQGDGKVVRSPLENLVGPGPDGRYVMEYVFPKAPERLFQLRLDGPLYTRCRLSNIDVTLLMNGEPVEGCESWEWTSTVAVDPMPDGSFLMQSDRDARMRMRFPKSLPAKAPVTLRVVFQLDPVLPSEIRTVLAEPDFRRDLEQALQRLGWTQSLDVVSPLPIPSSGEKQ